MNTHHPLLWETTSAFCKPENLFFLFCLKDPVRSHFPKAQSLWGRLRLGPCANSALLTDAGNRRARQENLQDFSHHIFTIH